jgi:hypothetical protein
MKKDEIAENLTKICLRCLRKKENPKLEFCNKCIKDIIEYQK